MCCLLQCHRKIHAKQAKPKGSCQRAKQPSAGGVTLLFNRQDRASGAIACFWPENAAFLKYEWYGHCLRKVVTKMRIQPAILGLTATGWDSLDSQHRRTQMVILTVTGCCMSRAVSEFA